jgi:hypothetical protein
VLIVFGTRFFGRVDRIPGLCSVVTKCFHICWIPLVPIESFVVLNTRGRGFSRGVSIGLSARSYLTAWARLFLVPPSVVMAFGEFASAFRRDIPAWTVVTNLALAALFSAVLWVLLRPNTASPARAAELLRALGRPVAGDRRYDQLLMTALRRPDVPAGDRPTGMR